MESSREELLSDVFVAVETLNLFQEIRHSLCSLFCPLKRGNNVLRVGPCENPPLYSHFLYVFGAQDTLTAFYNAAQHSLTHAHRRGNQKQITLYCMCLVAPAGLNSLGVSARARAQRGDKGACLMGFCNPLGRESLHLKDPHLNTLPLT